jgi:mycothiol synthase
VTRPTEGPLSPGQAAQVLELVAAATEADGVAPLSEHAMLHLRHEAGEADPARRDLLVTDADGGVAGYAYLDPPDEAQDGDASGELVIHPDRRRRGLGTALVSAVTAGEQGHGVRVWAHGDRPAAAAFAKTTGFTRFRELRQLLLSFPDVSLPEPTLPAGVTLRTFVPGSDEEAWLAVNQRAFAHHPEQGGWTRADLELREAEPWSDPAGFFLAERDGQLVGFHWTKVHPSGGPGDGPIGEVYVVGVDPRGQGGGLGKALTVAGLAHLRDQGLGEVMLYVDGDNEPAARLYEGLGFRSWHVDVMYRSA